MDLPFTWLQQLHDSIVQKPVTKLATAHAPPGGVTVAGKHFVGGQFIPGDVLAQATPEEKAKIEHRAEPHEQKAPTGGATAGALAPGGTPPGGATPPAPGATPPAPDAPAAPNPQIAAEVEKIKSEPTVPPGRPPGTVYHPDVNTVGPDGLTKAARVGLPGREVPPPPKYLPRLNNLTAEERAVEDAFAKRFEEDPDALVREYNEGQNKVVGQKKDGSPRYAIGDAPNIFGTDDVKMIDPTWNPPTSANKSEEDVLQSRSKYNAMLHQTANAVAKRAFLQYLDKLPADKKSVLVTAGGCHVRDTPILMFDGSLRLVQDVAVGDQVMGPDSMPRTVLRLVRGLGKLYQVTPKRGEPFVVNEDHVLSLRTRRVRGACKRRNMVTTNMTVKEVLARGKTFIRNSWLYRTGVEFPAPAVPLNPYFLGLWLGDGTHCSAGITTADPEIVEYIEEFAAAIPAVKVMKYTKPDNKASVYQIALKQGLGYGRVNPVMRCLNKLGVLRNKHIPFRYLVNSREVRLGILAGLLDSDGYLAKGFFEIVTRFAVMGDEILFLARSLGFGATLKQCYKTNTTTGRGGIYYRIGITGDISQIPTRIGRKRASARKLIRCDGVPQRNVLRSGYRLDPAGEGDYYGFTLDGDSLYLMGDFTVTHNCGSGKGYAIERVHEVNKLAKSVGAVYDSAGDQNGTENGWILDECKKRGIHVTYAYIHADPNESWAADGKGVVSRAGKVGRMVGAKVFTDSYVKGAQNFKAFMDAQKADPNVKFFTIDNTTRPGPDGKPLDPVLMPEFPQAALSHDPKQLYATCSKLITEKPGITPAVARGAMVDTRIWPHEYER